MATVLIPLAEGFEEVEAVSLIDVLRRGGVEVRTAHLNPSEGNNLVLGANGITLQANTSIENIVGDEFDMIVLPGGWGGTHALADNQIVQRLLKEFKEKNKTIGAICAAPYALDKAGVLGNDFTCYPSVEEQIASKGYRDDKQVVIDGNIMTSRGPATALCFALAILKHLVGEESFKRVKEGMLISFCDINS